MQWYPFITFWQVTADLIVSNTTPGYGHHYGPEVPTAWAAILPASTRLVALQQHRCPGRDRRGDVLVELVDLAGQLDDPAGSAGFWWPSSAHRRKSRGLLMPASDSRRVGSARTSTALSWLIACPRDLIADALASLNMRTISTSPSPDFAIAVARPDSTARAAPSASIVSVLPPPAAIAGVSSVHLDDRDGLGAQVAGQCRPVGTRALHVGAAQDTEASSPGEHLPVALGRGGEAAACQQDAHRGEHRCNVNVFVCVDAEACLLSGLLARITQGPHVQGGAQHCCRRPLPQLAAGAHRSICGHLDARCAWPA